ncbi:hypothetical protein HZH68_010518 [Vespula germanica]|uniref:Uncharacterized protein n=1 Tax=Vespula germanica TaxID=30212 RepID=A0A834JS97_VESGE|nr:hypothetical protein HZH68_010518 [Vespula germanica]
MFSDLDKSAKLNMIQDLGRHTLQQCDLKCLRTLHNLDLNGSTKNVPIVYLNASVFVLMQIGEFAILSKQDSKHRTECSCRGITLTLNLFLKTSL